MPPKVANAEMAETREPAGVATSMTQGDCRYSTQEIMLGYTQQLTDPLSFLKNSSILTDLQLQC